LRPRSAQGRTAHGSAVLARHALASSW
jgi:hypothetical protein